MNSVLLEKVEMDVSFKWSCLFEKDEMDVRLKEVEIEVSLKEFIFKWSVLKVEMDVSLKE